MDLERLGRADAAEQFLDHYQDLADDRFPAALVHFYIASRAYVRAKVACLRAEQGDENSRTEARQLHSLAAAHLLQAQVKLVLVGGLPGSGKSTVAAGVSRTVGWKVLRSDDVRRAMPPTEEEEGERRYGVGRYTPKATGAVYSDLLARAEGLLKHGESVILDASWIDGSMRMAARQLASQTDSDLVELCCHVRSDIADSRIAQRLLDNRDASEATPAVRLAMEGAMDPWPTSVEIDTSDSTVEESIARALGVLEPATRRRA